MYMHVRQRYMHMYIHTILCMHPWDLHVRSGPCSTVLKVLLYIGISILDSLRHYMHYTGNTHIRVL